MQDGGKAPTPDLYVSPWWQASVLPSRLDVCGIVVPPLSVWHVWALENTPPGVGSPYLSAARPPDLDDAAAVLLVAQHTRQEWIDHVQWDGRYRAKASKRVARYLRYRRPANVLAAVREYVTDCTRVPAHDYPDDAKLRTVRAPWTWHIVAALSGGDPDRAAVVWDLPYTAAQCMVAVLRDRQPGGDDSLADLRRQREIDEYAAAKKAGAL